MDNSKKIYTFKEFLLANEDPYFKGLGDSTKDKKKAKMKKNAKMDDDNPKAYKPMPGDEKGKDYLKKSKYTKKYNKLFKSSVNEDKIDSDKIEKGLKNKSKETKIPLDILREVMKRGMAAWRTGHRPGATQEQWGYARINSFATGGKTRQTTDKDLWFKIPSNIRNDLPGKKPQK